MQGGMWNGRASRRTRVSKSKHRDNTSAGIGTTVEHPPCKRMPDSKLSSYAGGHNGPNLRGDADSSPATTITEKM